VCKAENLRGENERVCVFIVHPSDNAVNIIRVHLFTYTELFSIQLICTQNLNHTFKYEMCVPVYIRIITSRTEYQGNRISAVEVDLLQLTCSEIK
jgi:hypothetical protein